MAEDTLPPPDPRDIPTLNIIASHRIASKVTRCLSLLYPAPTKDTTTDAPPKQHTAAPIVGLRTKSAIASKAITIAEITKRRISEQGGRWYQYNQISTAVEAVRPKQSKPKGRETGETTRDDKDKGELGGGDHDHDDDDDNNNNDEEDPFEVIPEKEPKRLRTITYLTIYISRARIPAFEKLYGYGWEF
jgi:hypothetical protein